MSAPHNAKALLAKSLASRSTARLQAVPPAPPPYHALPPTQQTTPMSSSLQPHPSANSVYDDDDDEPGFEVSDSPMSTVTISISTPMSVTGDNNFLAYDPAAAGATLANSLVNALKSASMSAAGIPMIDEDGRPRPIHVNVDATLRVEGRGNTISGRSVSAQAQANTHIHARAHALARAQALTRLQSQSQPQTQHQPPFQPGDDPARPQALAPSQQLRPQDQPQGQGVKRARETEQTEQTVEDRSGDEWGRNPPKAPRIG